MQKMITSDGKVSFDVGSRPSDTNRICHELTVEIKFY